MIKKAALAAAIIGIIFYSLYGTRPDFSAYSALLNKSRSEKNSSFRQSSASPLSATQKTAFDSLKYYPANFAFVVDATVSRETTPDTMLMRMSDKRTEKYLHWGHAQFTLDGKPQELGVYVKANGTDSTLFIPFTDRTNGHETYGGGRYLDAVQPKLNETGIKLDFNRAYNPFCAYNSAYSCPVPPAENQLQVPVPVGEKSFHD